MTATSACSVPRACGIIFITYIAHAQPSLSLKTIYGALSSVHNAAPALAIETLPTTFPTTSSNTSTVKIIHRIAYFQSDDTLSIRLSKHIGTSGVPERTVLYFIPHLAYYIIKSQHLGQ